MDPIVSSLFGVVVAGITGGFAWMAKQLNDLKGEVRCANDKHDACEKARFADGLKIQRLETTAEMLGKATGTTQLVNATLNPAHPEEPVSSKHDHAR